MYGWLFYLSIEMGPAKVAAYISLHLTLLVVVGMRGRECYVRQSVT